MEKSKNWWKKVNQLMEKSKPTDGKKVNQLMEKSKPTDGKK